MEDYSSVEFASHNFTITNRCSVQNGQHCIHW